jgi:hypothetical protein
LLVSKVSSACVGLNARNVLAPSPSSNNVFSTVAPWIAHSSKLHLNTCNTHHVERVKCPVVKTLEEE